MPASFVDVVICASKECAPDGITPTFRVRQGYQELLETLGYGLHDAPVACLLQQYHGLSGSWMVASPMHWEATHRDAMVRCVDAALQLDTQESRALCLAFAAFMAEEQMKVYFHDATTWLLQSVHYPAPEGLPPAHVLLNCSMRPALHALEQTPFWLRFLTESQMYFSAQSSTVNGLWVWGGSPLIAPVARPLVVCSDDRWLNAARHVSNKARSYDYKGKIEQGSVYFVPDSAWLNDTDLADALRDQRVRWHWNNMTYISPPRNWLSRLWRR